MQTHRARSHDPPGHHAAHDVRGLRHAGSPPPLVLSGHFARAVGPAQVEQPHSGGPEPVCDHLGDVDAQCVIEGGVLRAQCTDGRRVELVGPYRAAGLGPQMPVQGRDQPGPAQQLRSFLRAWNWEIGFRIRPRTEGVSIRSLGPRRRGTTRQSLFGRTATCADAKTISAMWLVAPIALFLVAPVPMTRPPQTGAVQSRPGPYVRADHRCVSSLGGCRSGSDAPQGALAARPHLLAGPFEAGRSSFSIELPVEEFIAGSRAGPG